VSINTQISRWVIQAAGAPSDLQRISSELGKGDPSGVVHNQSLYLESSELDKASSLVAAEWAAFDFMKLLSAAFEVHFDESIPLNLVSVRESDSDRADHTVGRHAAEPSLLQRTVQLALARPQAQTAILAYASGGPDGLFRAYEAMTYEILNLRLTTSSAGVGTREWLIEQGWITEAEDDRFLSTVLHFRDCLERQCPGDALSLKEAAILVRRLLVNLLRHCLELPLSSH